MKKKLGSIDQSHIIFT